MTATAEALHLKDYIESRGNGIRSLADELPEDTTLSQKIADIKEYYSYVQRYHVISVLLLAPNGEAIYSTDPQYSGMHFFRSDFWKYVIAQQAASGSVASGQKDVLNPIPPFAGSADTTDWMLIGSPMLSRMNSNKPRLLGAAAILFNQYGVIPFSNGDSDRRPQQSFFNLFGFLHFIGISLYPPMVKCGKLEQLRLVSSPEIRNGFMRIMPHSK